MSDVTPSSSENPAADSFASTRSRGFRLPAGVAIVLVLILVAAGGWFVWDQLKPEPRRDLSAYEPLNVRGPAPTRPRVGPRNPAGNQAGNPVGGFNVPRRGVPSGESVSITNDGAGTVRVDGARARFTRDGNGFRVDLIYIDPNLYPQTDTQALSARAAVLRDASAAREAGVSEEQVQKLRAIAYSREMAADEAARKKLLDQWTAYAAASADQRKELEGPMIEQLRQIAGASREPTRARGKAAADQVRAILSAEQITRLGGRGR